LGNTMVGRDLPATEPRRQMLDRVTPDAKMNV
jgi:hypothetical protein